MKIPNGCFALVCVVTGVIASTSAGWAQKHGGVLKIQHMDTPPSASIHEESDRLGRGAVHGALQQPGHLRPARRAEQPRLRSCRTSRPAGRWSDDGRALTFKLREGVKWHDGKPFTAEDVRLHLRPAAGKPRQAPAQSARRLVQQRREGDRRRRLRGHLPPQAAAAVAAGPARLGLLADLSLPRARRREMRRKPIGTGPFKFVEFKMNESIKLVKNPDYWKKGRPYLDGIEYTIIADRSTRMLSFVAGRFDMTFPTDVTVPLLKNIKRDAPQAQCTMRDDRRQHQPDRQSRRRAVRRSADPPRHGADPRSPGVHRHPQRGRGQDGRRHAAAARRRLGLAGGHARRAASATATSRRPARRPRADEAGGLRAGQAAEDQGQHAQHRDLPRSGGDPDRPAQAHLDRRRARDHRHHGLLQPRVQEGLRRGAEPDAAAPSTIPTSPSSRAMPAARCATTTATAIRR